MGGIADSNNSSSDAPGGPAFSGNYKAAYSRTDATLAISPGTVIFSSTGNGKLESFLLHLEHKDIKIKLDIDGTECFDIEMKLFDEMGIKKDENRLSNFPMYYSKDKKYFEFVPKYPIEYSVSFTITGTSTGNTKKVKGYVVTYTDE